MGSLETGLCRQLGIEHPVFSVGFGAGAGAEVVAAVSNAGGFWAGESCSVVDEVKPPGELVRDLVPMPEATHTDAEQLA